MKADAKDWLYKMGRDHKDKENIDIMLENMWYDLDKNAMAVWVNKVITKDKNITLDNFLEYDSNGIMIYINNSDEIIDLVFLCTPDKIQNVELLLSQLKRIKK